MGRSLGQFWTSQGIPYPVWQLGGSLCVVVQFTLYQRSVLLLGHWAGIHLVWPIGLRLPLCSLLIGGQASYQLSDKGPLGLHCQLCSGCGSSRSGHLPSVAHVMKATREVVSTRNSKCKEGAGLYRCSVVSPPASLLSEQGWHPGSLCWIPGNILAPNTVSQISPSSSNQRVFPLFHGRGLPWGTSVLYHK